MIWSTSHDNLFLVRVVWSRPCEPRSAVASSSVLQLGRYIFDGVSLELESVAFEILYAVVKFFWCCGVCCVRTGTFQRQNITCTTRVEVLQGKGSQRRTNVLSRVGWFNCEGDNFISPLAHVSPSIEAVKERTWKQTMIRRTFLFWQQVG